MYIILIFFVYGGHKISWSCRKIRFLYHLHNQKDDQKYKMRILMNSTHKAL